jgi:hypothetical protein
LGSGRARGTTIRRTPGTASATVTTVAARTTGDTINTGARPGRAIATDRAGRTAARGPGPAGVTTRTTIGRIRARARITPGTTGATRTGITTGTAIGQT